MLKRLTALFVVMCMAICMITITPSVSAAGSGTAGDPYRISSPQQFMDIKNNLSAHYILTTNIEISNETFGICNETTPFTGMLDGGGHDIIYNNVKGISLFGYIGTTGVVRNLNVSADISGGSPMGGIAAVNTGVIENCMVSGSVNGAKNVGGIVGINSGGTIRNCGSVASVYCVEKTAGGLIGFSEKGVVQNCYSAGEVSGSSEAGGFIGSNSGTSVENCYYDNQASKQPSGIIVGADNVTGKSTADMQKASTYSGWDFSKTWGIVLDGSYPYLIAIRGNGTAASPYKIRTVEDLKNINTTGLGDKGRGIHYVLENDISVNGGWDSIGDTADVFNGNFDGAGYFITFSSMSGSYQGLFAVLGKDAIIRNVYVKYIGGILVNESTGGIASVNQGRIERCGTYGYILAQGKNLGGIAGENFGTITECYSSISLEGKSPGVGGLVGYNSEGTIRNSYFNGVLKTSTRAVGGIAGDNSDGTIENCYVEGPISGNVEVGGIVGRNYKGSVKNSYSSAGIKGNDLSGGIIGTIVEGGNIAGCYYNSDAAGVSTGIGSEPDNISAGRTASQMMQRATYEGWDFSGTWNVFDGYTMPMLTAVSGDGSNIAPYKIKHGQELSELGKLGLKSLPGRRYYIIMNNISYNYSSVADNQNPFVGSINGQGNVITLENLKELFGNLGNNAFVGNMIIDASSTQTRSAALASYAQGAYIDRCLVRTPISSEQTATGGLVAIADNCKISNSGVETSVSGKGNTGGLVGQALDGTTITNCYVKGDVTGEGNVGGLVGSNNGATIQKCYAIGEVNGNTNVGGFAGRNDKGSIKDCYAESQVTGKSYVGGFAGANYTSISNAYHTGTVTAQSNGALFAAQNGGTIYNSFYINDTVPSEPEDETVIPDDETLNTPDEEPVKPSDDGSLPAVDTESGTNTTIYAKTTEEMKKRETFSGWDFNGTWSIKQGETMPYLTITTADSSEISVEPSGLTNEGSAPLLTDVAGHWAEADINLLVSKGVINGYEDRTYRPENSVTKAEFIKLLIQAKDVTVVPGITPYKDANSHWAKDFINTAFTKKLTDNINISEDYFGADETIMRVEAAVMMGRLVSPNYTGELKFVDSADVPEWAINAVAATVNAKYITGFPDGTFLPNQGLTRAEAAVIIKRVMGL